MTITNTVVEAFETYVNNHTEEERDSIKVLSSSGNYSLNEILQHMKDKTPVGLRFEKMFLQQTTARLIRKQHKFEI